MLSAPIDIVALHGFLGLPSDWQSIASRRPEGTRHWEAPNLWLELSRLPKGEVSFASWASSFVSRFSERGEEKPWLLGYSMGGRLASHAALEAPELFAGLVLVSSHPGLTNESERKTRIENDEKWARRFEGESGESWSEVLEAWNAQGVLSPPIRLPPSFVRLERRESDFDRALLGRAMREWSLGRQDDLSARLHALGMPVLLVTGEQDAKFTALSRNLTDGSSIEIETIQGVGHRVPWDDPDRFVSALANRMVQFAKGTSKC